MSSQYPWEISLENGLLNSYLSGQLSVDRWESREMFIDENSSNLQGKPTLVTRGLFKGYSLPVYSANDEELFFRMRIPFDWNRSTNPIFACITSISAAEGVGDKYKFQLEWCSEDVGNVIPDTTCETLTDEVIVSNGTAFYAEIVTFELDATTMVAGQNLQMRLRRIASAAPAVTNEIIIWHWDSRWKMSAVGSVSQSGY